MERERDVLCFDLPIPKGKKCLKRASQHCVVEWSACPASQGLLPMCPAVCAARSSAGCHAQSQEGGCFTKGLPVPGARISVVIQLVGISAKRGRLVSLLTKGKDLYVSVLCPSGFVLQGTESSCSSPVHQRAGLWHIHPCVTLGNRRKLLLLENKNNNKSVF